MRVNEELNSSVKFAVFYVSIISVALVGSLYASHLNARNHISFSFPPETQKVVEKRTATMEVWWRWLPETLEMIVKVNDDEFNIVEGFLDGENTTRDYLGLLFDSDNNGNLSNRSEPPPYSLDDHAVFVWGINRSWVLRHSYVNSYKSIDYPSGLCGLPAGGIFLVGDLNNTYFAYKEGEGYTYNVSIPLELINVKTPTPICINYFDGDYVAWLQSSGISIKSDIYMDEYYKALLFAEFTG